MTPSPEELSRKARQWFAGSTMIFCAGVIVCTTTWGDTGNSLHSSAQSWSFALLAGVLAGLGFGALAQFLPIARK